MKRPRWFFISKPALAGAVSLLLIAGTANVAGCGGTGVSLEYDPGADSVIVTVESDGGLPFPGDDLRPLFRLFGDGRFLRLEREGASSGLLVQGKLDGAAVGDLLRQLADTGFFELEDEYADPDAYDVTYRKIAVDLSETAKAVTVWMTEDVPEFDAAYDLILGYPVGETDEYVPELGYLVVTRYFQFEGDGRDFLEPGDEIYGLLPDTEALIRAAATNTAVEVGGSAFLALKRYDNAQNTRGLCVSQPDYVLVAYPVYEPRTAKKP